MLVTGLLAAAVSCPDGAAFCPAPPPIHIQRELKFTMPSYPILVETTPDTDNQTTCECYDRTHRFTASASSTD